MIFLEQCLIKALFAVSCILKKTASRVSLLGGKVTTVGKKELTKWNYFIESSIKLTFLEQTIVENGWEPYESKKSNFISEEV